MNTSNIVHSLIAFWNMKNSKLNKILSPAQRDRRWGISYHARKKCCCYIKWYWTRYQNHNYLCIYVFVCLFFFSPNYQYWYQSKISNSGYNVDAKFLQFWWEICLFYLTQSQLKKCFILNHFDLTTKTYCPLSEGKFCQR